MNLESFKALFLFCLYLNAWCYANLSRKTTKYVYVSIKHISTVIGKTFKIVKINGEKCTSHRSYPENVLCISTVTLSTLHGISKYHK